MNLIEIIYWILLSIGILLCFIGSVILYLIPTVGYSDLLGYYNLIIDHDFYDQDKKKRNELRNYGYMFITAGVICLFGSVGLAKLIPNFSGITVNFK